MLVSRNQAGFILCAQAGCSHIYTMNKKKNVLTVSGHEIKTVVSSADPRPLEALHKNVSARGVGLLG